MLDNGKEASVLPAVPNSSMHVVTVPRDEWDDGDFEDDSEQSDDEEDDVELQDVVQQHPLVRSGGRYF
jgi:hypothetical protein